jgi:hypothetical protein
VPTPTYSHRSIKIKHWGPLIPPNQRAYFSSHPLGFCVALGLAASGIVNLLFPQAVQETSAYLAFPSPLFYALSVAWAIGGVGCAWGLMRGIRNLEAGSDALLCSAILVQYIAVISIRSTSALASLYIPFIAIGFALRARHLTKTGYAVVAMSFKEQ